MSLLLFLWINYCYEEQSSSSRSSSSGPSSSRPSPSEDHHHHYKYLPRSSSTGLCPSPSTSRPGTRRWNALDDININKRYKCVTKKIRLTHQKETGSNENLSNAWQSSHTPGMLQTCHGFPQFMQIVKTFKPMAAYPRLNFPLEVELSPWIFFLQPAFYLRCFSVRFLAFLKYSCICGVFVFQRCDQLLVLEGIWASPMSVLVFLLELQDVGGGDPLVEDDHLLQGVGHLLHGLCHVVLEVGIAIAGQCVSWWGHPERGC